MALILNNHVFKGHKTLLGNKYVTYGELDLPTRYELASFSATGFDWGNAGRSAQQLAFSILCQVSDPQTAEIHTEKFVNEVVKMFSTRDWILSASDVLKWIEKNTQKPIMKKLQPLKSTKKKKAKTKKTNVVKEVCKELQITQKTLAEILEVPEGTVSSWAVKNEIPRLGRKAIEFYILSVKNQKIVDSYRSFKELLEAS
jgi:DNA-binding transcriptional regulator YiaG